MADLAAMDSEKTITPTPEAPAEQQEQSQDVADTAEPHEGDVETKDDTGAEPEKSEKSEKDEKSSEPERPKSRAQRRIEDLSAQLKNAQRESDHWKSRAKAAETNPKLNPLDFPNDAAYQAALIDRAVKQSQQGFAQQQGEVAKEQATVLEQQIWNERVAEFSAEAKDFETVVYRDDFKLTPHSLQFIRKMPEGPKIVYHLGSNKAEELRFAQMSPVETAIEMGRLAERLSRPPARVVTQAPKPVPTVKPTGGSGFKADGGYSKSFESWMDQGGY